MIEKSIFILNLFYSKTLKIIKLKVTKKLQFFINFIMIKLKKWVKISVRCNKQNKIIVIKKTIVSKMYTKHVFIFLPLQYYI